MTRKEQIIEILKELTDADDSFYEDAADAILALPLETISDSWINMKVRDKKGSLAIMTREELIGYELGFRAGRDEIIKRNS